MVIAIAAVDNNWGIGRNGDLLVNIPEDKKFFKHITNNSVVIMGRKTWDSLPKKPLPNRENYVITKTPENHSENGVKFITLSEAIQMIENSEINSRIFVIGGGQIYKELLPYCAMAVITKVYKDFEADTFFPNLSTDENWIVTGEAPVQYYNEIPYQFFIYENMKKRWEEVF